MTDEQLRRPKVLVIEDSEFIHRLLRVRLKQEPLEILSAYNGTEGLEMAHSVRPDVIMLDIELPVLDGFEVLTVLKSDPELHDTPVIFISGKQDTATKVRCFDLGAVDFVAKPFNLAELKARLRSAIRINSLIQMLAQRAKVDALTGLWNRAYFDERLGIEVNLASRHGRTLSLLMCDIDHFKRLNDKFGHPFGDLVLEVVGTVLEHGRAGDIACRYGGEEFAVILPDTIQEDAVIVAERLRRRLDGQRWDGRPEVHLTMSVGVATLDPATPSAQTMLHNADSALYAAKSAGRDRVAIFDHADPTGTAGPTCRITA
jgi:diguanylate cyclase (GGDEF)-like protein